ncbi:MAG TPA: hypothetical protein VL970_11735 [Candidatus Acidoferrales bacterium]|nr:hypothetical protein [Candidatus Acidoferrales bacterium]
MNQKKQHRWRRRLLMALGTVIILIGIFYLEEDWRGWHAWRQAQKEWEAKGEQFDPRSVQPPSVPEDQNFALAPLVFTCWGQQMTRDGKTIPPDQRDPSLVNRMRISIFASNRQWNGRTNVVGNWRKAEVANLAAWQNYYRASAATTNLLPVTQPPQSPARDILLALGKYQPAIAELREAAKLPGSRFPLDYDTDRPYRIFVPHLNSLSSCAQVLELQASAELQNGQGDQALADVKLCLRLADSIHDEPFLVSQFTRMDILNMAVQSIYDGLAGHWWSHEQLADLDSALAGEDCLAGYPLAIRGEINLDTIRRLQFLRHRPEFLGSAFGPESPPYLAAQIIGDLIPSGVFYQNQLRCVRLLEDQYLPVVDIKGRTVSPILSQRAQRKHFNAARHLSPYNLFELTFLRILPNAAARFAQGQNALDLARTAIALERYRQTDGDYPESLNALLPSFISQIPADVIGGKPLKYRRDANGQFVLYSLGWNGIDDHGAVVLTRASPPNVDLSRGDWVWRYP